jgi:hypothetical protein
VAPWRERLGDGRQRSSGRNVYVFASDCVSMGRVELALFPLLVNQLTSTGLSSGKTGAERNVSHLEGILWIDHCDVCRSRESGVQGSAAST